MSRRTALRRGIEVVWLALVGALSTSCLAPSGPDGETEPIAELIISGGPILTLDEQGSVAEAVAVAGGRIVAIGDLEEIRSVSGPTTRREKLDGRVLMPGFVDHHVHLLNLGMSLRWAEEIPDHVVDLAGVASQKEIAERLADRAQRLPVGTWLIGQGWSQSSWGSGRLPDHHVLSGVAPNHPVFLTRVDGHCGWLNARAMQVAGIDRDTPDPPGGAVRRTADGQPSGVLLERANEQVTTLLPSQSRDDVASAFRLAADTLAAQGVVEVFDAGFLAVPGVVDLGADFERYLQVLADLDNELPLPLRVNLMIPAPSSLASRLLADDSVPRRVSPRVRITHLKLFLDGALGSRGALLTHSYADDPETHGVRRMSTEELRATALAAVDRGLDVATHAIGDQAVADALNVYTEILDARPGLAPGRLRLEHFSYARSQDFERAARLGIVLSIQPNFVIPGDDGEAMEDSRVGVENSPRVYAWGRLSDLGARLVFGSDYFTRPFQPLYTYYAAVTRKNPRGLPANGWHPSERLDRLRALRWSTTVSPPGGAQSQTVGLAVGHPADLIVLSDDPLSATESEILQIAVETTYLAGEPVFRESSASR